MSIPKFPYFIYFSKDLISKKEQEIFFSKKGYIYASFDSTAKLKKFLQNTPKKIIGCLINFNAETEEIKKCISLILSYKLQHKPEFFALLSDESIIEKQKAFEWGISEYFSPSRPIEETNQKIELILTKKLLEWDNFKKEITHSLTIIDDSLNILDSLKSSFISLGFQKILTFSSGEEALKNFNPTDIFIVDIIMGKISGLETITEIRKRKPDALIFSMSSIKAPELAQKAIERGANDFLPKPLSPSELSLKILKALKDSIL